MIPEQVMENLAIPRNDCSLWRYCAFVFPHIVGTAGATLEADHVRVLETASVVYDQLKVARLNELRMRVKRAH